MLAAIRPDSWNLPLFLHVLGSTALFGTTATVAVTAFAVRLRPVQAALLARVTFWTFLLGIVPSWVLMRFAGQWIDDKEFPKNGPGWVDVGFIVSEGGGVLLIVLGILAWLSSRRHGGARLTLVVGALASIVLVALGVAWFAMSAKPDW